MDKVQKASFHGWRVVRAAFVIAVFGLGFGFYGPPVFLQAIRDTRGWSLALVSAAVTLHFLVGAAVTANLPSLYRRFGIARVTKAGAVLLAAGVLAWAAAVAPWQLFVAALVSGAAWVTMGVAAVNAMVSPWFMRERPAALAMAYNGANVGGIVFAPLWAAAIDTLGFPLAALVISFVMVGAVWLLADVVLSRSPEKVGVDGDEVDASSSRACVMPAKPLPAKPLPGRLLWRNRKFLTLAAGMALGLFAQIGVTAHLFSLLSPAIGAREAGLAMALVTVMAIAGRTLLGWTMPARADRRLVASASYAIQIAGSVAFIVAAGTGLPWLLLGVVLFGLGFGNGTFLPPLIAQAEFASDDVARVVALIVAIAQGAYAFAPAAFGLLRDVTGSAAGSAPLLFVAAAALQSLAIAAFLAGRR